MPVIQLKGFEALFDGVVVLTGEIVLPGQASADFQIQGIELCSPGHGLETLLCPARGNEQLSVPVVGGGISGIEAQRMQESLFGGLPIPFIDELEHGQTDHESPRQQPGGLIAWRRPFGSIDAGLSGNAR